MKGSKIAGGAVATVLVLLALAAAYRALEQATPPEIPLPSPGEEEAHQSLLYGRITTVDGATFEGRLRFGGGQEAFWGDYFNGAKNQNPWAALVPPERLPKERRPFEIFGFEISDREYPIDLGRLFMARFGDIARVEAGGRDVRVTLKSGTVFDLRRSDASDFDDGVRVWDGARGVADLDSLRIRTIEFLPPPRSGRAPDRLYGKVHTPHGDFIGFVQWNREVCLGSDLLEGRTAEGERKLRFDTIRAIARRSDDSSMVTLVDGREVVLTATRAAGKGNLGVYVDDPRYGRVLVSWDAFEVIDFSAGGNGPAYSDFPPGGPLTGSVTTGSGRRVAGRLGFDMEESELTETLDAPSGGIDYTLPFGLVASIVLPSPEARGAQHTRVTLHNGEELQLERAGDLGKGNAGMLVFVDGRQSPEYVPWGEVQRIELDRPPAMYPPPGGR